MVYGTYIYYTIQYLSIQLFANNVILWVLPFHLEKIKVLHVVVKHHIPGSTHIYICNVYNYNHLSFKLGFKLTYIYMFLSFNF